MLVDTVNFDNSDVDDFNFWGDTDSSDSDFFGNGFDTESDSGWDDTDSGRLLVKILKRTTFHRLIENKLLRFLAIS